MPRATRTVDTTKAVTIAGTKGVTINAAPTTVVEEPKIVETKPAVVEQPKVETKPVVVEQPKVETKPQQTTTVKKEEPKATGSTVAIKGNKSTKPASNTTGTQITKAKETKPKTGKLTITKQTTGRQRRTGTQKSSTTKSRPMTEEEKRQCIAFCRCLCSCCCDLCCGDEEEEEAQHQTIIVYQNGQPVQQGQVMNPNQQPVPGQPVIYNNQTYGYTSNPQQGPYVQNQVYK